MRGMSVGQLMGTVGNAPELRTGQSGTPWTRVSLAVNRRDEPEWWDVTLFGKKAELAQRLLRPGVNIVAVGELEIDSWVDQEGRTRKSTRLKATDFTITSYPNGSKERRTESEEQPQAAAS